MVIKIIIVRIIVKRLIRNLKSRLFKINWKFINRIRKWKKEFRR